MIVQNQNYLGAMIERGENLTMEMIIRDPSGIPVNLDTFIPQWRVQSQGMMAWSDYDLSNGVSKDPDIPGHIRLDIPEGVMTDWVGYRHFLHGYFEGEEPEASKLVARGIISIRSSQQDPIARSSL